MAIALDSAVGENGADAAATAQVTGFVVGSNSNRLLLALMGYDGDYDGTTGVIFSGDALSQNAGATIENAGFAAASVWFKDTPDIATADIVCTFDDTHRAAMFGVSLHGVDLPATFPDQDEVQASSGTAASLTLTTQSGWWVVGILVLRHGSTDPGTLVIDAGGTEIDEFNPVGANGNMRCAAQYKVASGSSTAIGWTWTTTSPHAMVAVVVPALATGGVKRLLLTGVGN